MAAQRCEKCIKARPGQRVVRGPNWWGGEEDGGSHCVGTVVSICEPATGSGYTSLPVEVRWDSGEAGYYRAGCTSGTLDLRLIDAGPSGLAFPNITCGFCETKVVIGTRWKCANCADYNLCHPCYMSDKHNLEHEFLRYDEPEATGVPVSSRKTSEKFQFCGIFPGAEVQSDKRGKTGVIGNVRGNARLLRKTVSGKWCYYNTDTVDCSLKFKKAASGGFYYRDHMPALALPGHDPKDIALFRTNQEVLSTGDHVRVISDFERLNYLLRYDFIRIPGCRGQVVNVKSSGLVETQIGSRSYTISPSSLILLHKVSKRQFKTPGLSITAGSKGLGYELSKMRALHIACHSGEEDVVTALLIAEADLEEADDNGDQATHYAAGCNQYRILELLLNSGADTGACNKFNETPLHVAIKENSVACALLLAKNIKTSAVNIQDNEGDTVLHLAINAGMEQEIISLILQVPGVNVSIKNDHGDTPLHIAASKGTLCMFLLAPSDTAADPTTMYGAKGRYSKQLSAVVNTKDGNGMVLLHREAMNGRRHVAQMILEQGYTAVDTVSDKGLKTALSIAVEHGHCKFVEVLIKAGADLNKEDADGNAPLHISLTRNHLKIARLLVASGCDVNKQDANRNAPLHISLTRNNCEIAETLVAAGADVNQQDSNGNTPLHISLLSRPALKASDLRSTTAPKLKMIATELQKRQNAEIDSSFALACFLVNSGSSLKTKNARGLNPLNIAGSMPVVRELLKWLPKTRGAPVGDVNDTPGVEGAAGLTGNVGGPVECKQQALCSSEKEEPQQEEMDERRTCAICMERERTVAFLCGHGTCQQCSTKIKQCHVCRAPVEKIIRLFEG